MKAPFLTSAALSSVVLAGVLLTGCAGMGRAAQPTPTSGSAIPERGAKLADPMQALRDLQQIADENGKNRATGTAGGAASADYIVSQLKGLGLTPTVDTFTTKGSGMGRNILVDVNTGSTDKVAVFGAHFDSVPEGPGIVDNGSGVANLLSLAQQLATQPTEMSQTLRLAFWDAEETGVEGSTDYVTGLNQSERKRITSYINVDMSAGTGTKLFVLDADKSGNYAADAEKAPPMPAGSVELEAQLRAAFPKGTDFLEGYEHVTRSDGLVFNAASIPVNGISTVIDETPLESIIPCYHQACDDISKVDESMLARTNAALRRLATTLARQ